MSVDIIFHESISGWFFQLFEAVKIRFMQGKNRKDENFFLIN